jgi:HEAT repeat protein
VAALGRHPEADASLLPEFRPPARAIDPLCDLLIDVDMHSLHAHLQTALVELAKLDLESIRARVDLAPPAAARLLVQVLAQVSHPDAEQAITAATSHVEARVRKEAVCALAATGKANVRRISCARSTTTIPRSAPRRCSRCATRSAKARRTALAERPLAVLGGPRFAEQSVVERRAYFDALVGVGGPVVLATLDAWLGLWRLGGGGELKARRELAAPALARMPQAEAHSTLKKHAKSLIPGVRGASRKALGESQERAA